jgi:hypothetical protein
VPAVPVRKVRLPQETHSCFLLNRLRLEPMTSLPKTAIDLLQGYKIGVELANHVDDPCWGHDSVRASEFMNVVRCDFHDFLESPLGNLIYRA